MSTYILLGYIIPGIQDSFSNSQPLQIQFCLMYSPFSVQLAHATIQERKPQLKTKLLITEYEKLGQIPSANYNKVFSVSFILAFKL